METQHWLMLMIIALVFYLIGARYPTLARQIGF
jgi:hypothetical protein